MPESRTLLLAYLGAMALVLRRLKTTAKFDFLCVGKRARVKWRHESTQAWIEREDAPQRFPRLLDPSRCPAAIPRAALQTPRTR